MDWENHTIETLTVIYKSVLINIIKMQAFVSRFISQLAHVVKALSTKCHLSCIDSSDKR